MAHAVLIIEDEATLARNVASYLEMHGYEAHVCKNGASGLAAYARVEPDVTLLDLRLPDMDGIEVLQRLRQEYSHTVVIMMTAFGDMETAVEAMKAGAHDFLRKPLSLDEVKTLIDRTIDGQRTSEAVRRLGARPGTLDGLQSIIGRSQAIAAVKDKIAKLVAAEARLAGETPPPVLITGETGTGKELVARAIHLAGPRQTGPFIELNCAALPTELVESELFGHERGAFTHAVDRKIGLIEAAHRGTLFLDEIGEMDPGTQAKILKVMEDRLVRRVGGTRSRAVDVRFVAATNRRLDTRDSGAPLREDLLFRLSVARFDLPPLRDRAEDIVPLAEHFLAMLAARYGRGPLHLSDSARDRLQWYSWPGNIRELRNVLERAMLFSIGDSIQLEDISMPVPHPETQDTTRASVLDSGAAETELWANIEHFATMERELLVRALVTTGWNVSKAARALNITRDQARYRIEKYGLKPTSP